jgi:hypothetical protein
MHGIGTSGRSKVTALMSGDSEQLDTYTYSIFARNFWKKSWRRTQIFLKIFLGIFQKNQKKNILKKVGSVHRFGKKSENCWRRTQIFMKKKCYFFDFFWFFWKKIKKNIFWKKLEAYLDLEKNQKIVGDVHRFLWKYF